MSFLYGWFLSYRLRRFRVPRDVLRYSFQKLPSRAALASPQGTLTYGALWDRVGRLCALWRQLGVKKGDALLTHLTDGWEQVEIRLAGLVYGLVQVGLGGPSHAKAVLAVLDEIPPRLFIFDPTLPPAAELIRARYPSARILAIGAGGTYEEGLASHSPEIPDLDIMPSDICSVGTTSGTTGVPKILPQTQGVILESLRLMAANLSHVRTDGGVFLLGVPFAGAGGGILFPWLLTRGLLVITPHRDAETLLNLARQHQATLIFVTPSQLIDLLDSPAFTPESVPSLKEIVYGTAAMPAAKLEEAIHRFGPIFRQGYGMAEVLPPVSLLSPQEHGTRARPASRQVLSSAGHIVRGVQIRIEENPGVPAPRGVPGMVWVKSPTLFSGYWRRPDLNASIFKDGFLRTGDYGFLDGDGRLHILAREQDVLTEEGQPVFPRSAEEAAHDHPAVKEACLVERPGSTEKVLCVSFRKAWRDRPDRGRLLHEVLSQVRAHPHLGHGGPDSARLFDELPRSLLAKVVRGEVREDLAAGRFLESCA